jgi:hypothetical protein
LTKAFTQQLLIESGSTPELFNSGEICRSGYIWIFVPIPEGGFPDLLPLQGIHINDEAGRQQVFIILKKSHRRLNQLAL